MNAELAKSIAGVNWNFSQNIRDNVMESLSGVKGDNSIKIFGPDLDELERLAAAEHVHREGLLRGSRGLAIRFDAQQRLHDFQNLGGPGVLQTELLDELLLCGARPFFIDKFDDLFQIDDHVEQLEPVGRFQDRDFAVRA